ncbi:40S ribosomal protein S15-4 [Glycine soja]
MHSCSNLQKAFKTQGSPLMSLAKPKTNVFLVESPKALKPKVRPCSNTPKLVSYLMRLTRKPMTLVKKLRKAKREAPTSEKPELVRTYLCNMIIVPEMSGSITRIYHGKTFNHVEIKPEMIGHYLIEFTISYKPVKHDSFIPNASNR